MFDTPNADSTMYLAVVIGLKVQFHKTILSGNDEHPVPQIVEILAEPNDLGPYHLRNDQESISKILHKIRVHSQEYGFGTVGSITDDDNEV